MAMGVVDDTDLEAELNRLNNPPVRPTIKNIHNGGRTEGDVNIPLPLRKVIAESMIEGGTEATKVLIDAFGVSKSSADSYKNGSHSLANYNQPNAELKAHVDNVKLGIKDKAQGRLIAAIDAITEKKLNDCKPRDLAGIARDMSAVVKDMEPEVGQGNTVNNQFILYSPRFIPEDRFDTIVVNE